MSFNEYYVIIQLYKNSQIQNIKKTFNKILELCFNLNSLKRAWYLLFFYIHIHL